MSRHGQPAVIQVELARMMVSREMTGPLSPQRRLQTLAWLWMVVPRGVPYIPMFWRR